MKHTKKNLFQALLWLTLGLVPQLVWAEVPNVINYQGYLTDNSSSPLNGTVDVTLTFWDALTDGNTLGSPKLYPNANVNNGVFSINVDVSDITFDKPVYVETTVNGEILAPRQLVTGVPFANQAADADKLDGLDSSEFITSEMDPTVPAELKDGVSWNEVSNRPAGLDDGDDVGITAETDPTVPANLKDGVNWNEVTNRPAGLDDGDDVGIMAETDPEVGSNTTNYVPKWNGSALVTGTIYDNGNVGIGTTSPGAKLDVNGDIVSNEYRRKIGSSEVDPNRYINILYDYKKSSANSLCSSGLAIATPFHYLGKTGSEICAADYRGKTTCKAVKFVYGAWAGYFGIYSRYDKTCKEEITASWPWAIINTNRPNTLDSEWNIRTFVVCCE